MPVKFLTPSQCETLHKFYPPPNCCICNAKAEIAELKKRIQDLEEALAAKAADGPHKSDQSGSSPELATIDEPDTNSSDALW